MSVMSSSIPSWHFQKYENSREFTSWSGTNQGGAQSRCTSRGLSPPANIQDDAVAMQQFTSASVALKEMTLRNFQQLGSASQLG